MLTTYTDQTFTISTEDEAIAGILPAAGESVTLTLKETDAPEGYTGSSTEYSVVISATAAEEAYNSGSDTFITVITYTMTIDGEEELEVKNTKNIGEPEYVHGYVTINKVDQDGEALEGATFTLDVYQEIVKEEYKARGEDGDDDSDADAEWPLEYTDQSFQR